MRTPRPTTLVWIEVFVCIAALRQRGGDGGGGGAFADGVVAGDGDAQFGAGGLGAEGDDALAVGHQLVEDGRAGGFDLGAEAVVGGAECGVRSAECGHAAAHEISPGHTLGRRNTVSGRRKSSLESENLAVSAHR